MKKLLITGAGGFLGYHLLRAAADRFETYGIYHQKAVTYHEATALSCDITNYIELGNILDDIEPDVVIHAAAISDTNFCQQNRTISQAVNVQATENLAGICSDYHIPFVFTSSDLVFDGTKGNYLETDAKNPLNIYGEQKSIAEEDVLKIYPEALVVRLPLMFGHPEAGSANYLQKFITQLKNGEPATLFTDEYRSVCGAKSIAEGILKLTGNSTGIIHLAGKEKLSRYEFGSLAAKALGLDEKLLARCSQKDVKMAAPRPADVSLNISKALSLGFTPAKVVEELELIADKNYYL